MKLRGKWTRKHSYHTAGIMVAAFMVIAAGGFWMVRSLLLENAQRLGNELANQYAELELQDVRSAELLLTAGVWTMEDLEASGADADPGGGMGSELLPGDCGPVPEPAGALCGH